jgi:hypothetical protein
VISFGRGHDLTNITAAGLRKRNKMGFRGILVYIFAYNEDNAVINIKLMKIGESTVRLRWI